MYLEGIDHCSIRTVKLEATRAFYEDVLGFKNGDRPDFDFPGHWLYLNGHPLLHLIGVDPDDKQGLVDYLGDTGDQALNGTGAFDHMALKVIDPGGLVAALRAHEVPYRDRKVPNMDLHQIFLEDPNGVTIELNCYGLNGVSPFELASNGATSKAARKKPAPGREELLDRARALEPALKARAAEAEELRRLPDASIDDLHESGLWRIVQPARFGGGEHDYALIIEATMELGRACGSTGWVFANFASHHWMVAMWPPKAQIEVWGDNPDTLIGTSLIYPAGRAKKVKGGYELTGRWPFCSGILHADWIIVGGLVEEAKGAPPEPRMFLVAKSALELIDTWDVLGLIATGSIDTAGEDMFIAEHMTLAAEQTRGGATPGSELNPSPLYRLPQAALFPHLIAAPIVAMAAGIYDTCAQVMATRVSTFNASKVAGHATTQLRLAETGAAVDAARYMLIANADEATRIATAGQPPSVDQKMRWRRDGAYAATLAGNAANQLYRGTGGSAIYAANPLQRQYRDMNAGLSHIGVSMDVNGVGYGRVALGLEPDIGHI